MRKLFICLLALLVVTPLYAGQRRKPRVRVEWGVLGGLSFSNYTPNMDIEQIENKLGWQAGISMALNFGAIAVEPQIFYARQGFRVQPEGGKVLNLKSGSIDVPILASLRMLHPVRIFVGPVITLMNDCKQKSGGDLLDFGRIRPTLSYTAGVGVVARRHLLIELRYNGQFRAKHDVLLPDGSSLEKLRSYSFSFNFGYLF